MNPPKACLVKYARYVIFFVTVHWNRGKSLPNQSATSTHYQKKFKTSLTPLQHYDETKIVICLLPPWCASIQNEKIAWEIALDLIISVLIN